TGCVRLRPRSGGRHRARGARRGDRRRDEQRRRVQRPHRRAAQGGRAAGVRPRGRLRLRADGQADARRVQGEERSAGRRMTVREAIEAGDVAALTELLAEDVEFRSPAVYKPYHGRDTVLALLGVVAQVFENFRYANEWTDGRTTILFFEA